MDNLFHTLKRKLLHLGSVTLLVLVTIAIWPAVSNADRLAGDKPQEPLSQAVPPAEVLSASGVVTVTVTVRPLRVLVVDEEGTITQIWSNTDQPNHRLVGRLGSDQGPEVPITQEIRSQYQALLGSIDWQKRGRVY
ncbi:MAG: hypothetical protein ACE5NP_01950 [Anaerolineae bacterium]